MYTYNIWLVGPMKALQNILATIIIIGVAIAVTIAVGLWISGFISGKTGIHKAEINEYSPAVLSGLDDAVLITIHNKGSTPISLEKIFFNQEPFEHYSNCLRGYIVAVNDKGYSVEVTTSSSIPLLIDYSSAPGIASYYGVNQVDGIIINNTYDEAKISLIEKIISKNIAGAALLYDAVIYNENPPTQTRNQWYGLHVGYIYNGSLVTYYKYSAPGTIGWRKVFLKVIRGFNPYTPHTFVIDVKYDKESTALEITYIVDGIKITSFSAPMNYAAIYWSYAGLLYTGTTRMKILVDDHLIYIHGPNKDYRQEIGFERTAPNWITLGTGTTAYVHPSMQDTLLQKIYIAPGETAEFYVYLDAAKVAHGLKFLLRIIDSEGYIYIQNVYIP